MRPTPEQRPIDANLPPDTPLEPGSGAPRHRPGSAAARIAASEAALGKPRSAAADYNAKAAALAAARNAAKSAYLDTPVQVPKSMRPKRRSWFKRRPEEEPATLPEMHSNAPVDRDDDADLSLGKRALKHLKTLLIIASVAIIVVGTVQTAIDLLTHGEHATAPDEQVPVGAPSTPPPQSAPSRPMPTPEGPLPTAPAVDPDTTGQIGRPFVDSPGQSRRRRRPHRQGCRRRGNRAVRSRRRPLLSPRRPAARPAR
jgi:localization factor PodJL